ncbi:MAG: hypothetical protein AAFY26_10000 [Cyanobacteria bacterium J06638_22]
MESRALMTLGGLSIADLTALLMMGLTLITTVASILLWLSTRHSVHLLVTQVQHQRSDSYTDAKRQIIDSHRDIFFGLLNIPTLLENFTQANGLDARAWELHKISAFLINQVMLGYLHFRSGIIDAVHFEGFKRDACDVFSYRTVRSHWEEVKFSHTEEFRCFVESELIPLPIENDETPDPI